MSEPLKVEQQGDVDVITIEGVRYAGELFRTFGFGPIGAVLRIEARDDGVVTVTRLYEHEAIQVKR